MNRAVLFARLAAVIILIVFGLLMLNLYGKLRRMQPAAPAPVTTPTATQ